MEPRTAFALAGAIGISAIPVAAHAQPRDLLAGQHLYVGTLDVCDDGFDLVVTFDLSDTGSSLLATHLYLGASAPASHAPGRFPYQHDGLASPVDAYAVALSDLGLGAGDRVYVAAHAEVSAVVGYEAPALLLDPALPPTATLTAEYPGADSYWAITLDGGGALDGAYAGWCVDTSRTMASDTPYTVVPISSYDPAAAAYVDHPENLDALNWLVNGDFVGLPATSCGGDYTFSDVQLAIWTLIEDAPSTAGLVDWSECRAQALVAAALAQGEGYAPGCLDAMVLLLVPIDPNGDPVAQIIIAQVTVVDVDLACDPILRNETAWASGDTRFRRSWASYFTYVVGSNACAQR